MSESVDLILLNKAIVRDIAIVVIYLFIKYIIINL